MKLNLLSGIVKNSNHMPILSCVKLVSRDGRCEVTGTNLSTTIVLDFEFPGDDFELVTPLDVLNRALSSYNNIIFTSSGKCRSGTSSFKLKTFPIDDYPVTVPVNCSFQSVSFKRASILSKCLPSKPDVRQYMNGVRFCNGNLYATDGYRIGRCASKIEHDSDVVVSSEVFNLISKWDGEIGFSKDRVFYKFGNALVVGQLIDSKAPDYDRLFVKHENTIRIDKLLLSDALSKSSIFDAFVLIKQSDDKKTVEVSTNESINVVDVISSEGNAFMSKFNISYLNGILGDVIYYKDSDSAILIEHSDMSFVVMPVRI